MDDKVVLAYSGGLDTTVAVRWLTHTEGLDVVALLVDVGQGGDIDTLRRRALESGAVDAVVVDARGEFADDYLSKALAANALYQGKYPLVSALSRPLICHHLARVARLHAAKFVAHGCTGKGNDQVRFEVSLAALAPDLEVMAPVRSWGMTRDQTMEYAAEHQLPTPIGPRSPYSIDENLWGRAIECGVLEDPFAEPPEEIWKRTVRHGSVTAHTIVEVEFRHGLPVALDGNQMSFAELITALEQLAGSYGFGRVDMIEDRVVGIKSREVYEAPGSLALIAAHSDLEELTLDKQVLRTKRRLEATYAELVYDGYWHSPLREALDGFVGATQRYVNGVVRLKLEPGTAHVVGRRSGDSLYDTSLATYDREDEFDHRAAQGFVKLWGLPVKTWARTHSGQRPQDGGTMQGGPDADEPTAAAAPLDEQLPETPRPEPLSS
jgi:argininosuccinate synthase